MINPQSRLGKFFDGLGVPYEREKPQKKEEKKEEEDKTGALPFTAIDFATFSAFFLFILFFTSANQNAGMNKAYNDQQKLSLCMTNPHSEVSIIDILYLQL